MKISMSSIMANDKNQIIKLSMKDPEKKPKAALELVKSIENQENVMEFKVFDGGRNRTKKNKAEKIR